MYGARFELNEQFRKKAVIWSMGIWSFIVSVFSFEWLLTRAHLTNGGEVIFLRSLLSTSALYTVIIMLKNIVDPTSSMTFDYMELRREFVQTIPWFGAIFASIYVALYTRFASQWRYMADLYNKIKETESKYPDINEEALSAWKAGYMEDAFELHLATKGIFASVICAWCQTPDVRMKFMEATGLDETKYSEHMKRVAAAYEKRKGKWQ